MTTTRGGWAQYEELLATETDDAVVAAITGKSLDAIRLKRNRMDDGYIGLDILYFDLETTDLKALMGRILCASFADGWGKVTTFRSDKMPRQHPLDDRELAIAIRDRLESADVIVGHNSKLFDVPFLNARLLKWDERPMRKDIKHIDTMYFARGQFVRIGSSKLVNVQKFAQVESEKSDIDWDTWQLAGMGDKAALDTVVDHCERDVKVLREVFGKLKVHVANIHR